MRTGYPETLNPSLEPLVRRMAEWFTDTRRSLQSRACAATVLGNLSAHEQLREAVLTHATKHLADCIISKNTELARAAAKSLLNVSLCSRDAKTKVIAELP